MEYLKIKNKPKVLISLTSLTHLEFDKLCKIFTMSLNNILKYYTLEGKIRQRSSKVRCNSIFKSNEEMLLFILSYYKSGSIQEVHAWKFSITQSKANRYIHLFTRILRQCLVDNNYNPLRNGMLLKNKLEQLGVSQCYIDGTEREIPRSTDYETQKEYYSGKAKKHTVKNNIISDNEGRILYLSETYNGKTHDKKILDESILEFEKNTVIYLDTGFQGFKSQVGITIMPTKKKKNKDLTSEEKQENTRIAKDRVRNEHAIGGIKRLRILKDKVRIWANDFHDVVMEIAYGLQNFRVSMRRWKYPELKTNMQNYISNSE